MEDFNRIFQSIKSDQISFTFSCVIAAVLLLALLARFGFFSKRLGGLDRGGPATLTTLGVLGTFTGVFIGLLDFDVSKIDESIPALLDGLKIAFATSIVGMGAAIVLKVIQGIVPPPKTELAETTPEAIHETLMAIKDAIELSSKTQVDGISDLKKAITSDNDTSLLTQIQKLRSTVQDGQNDLIREFRDFARNMAENNTKALIEALERVIRDFNTQLNEQFGENFKELNRAVGALLEWQERYKLHVESLEKNFAVAVSGIQNSEAALKEISSHTANIPKTMADLSELLNAMRTATADLAAHLQAVATLKEQAIKAFPTIEQNLRGLTDEFGSSVRDVVRQASEAVEQQKAAFAKLDDAFETLAEKSDQSRSQFENAIKDTLETMRSSMDKATQDHAGLIAASGKAMEKSVTEALSKTHGMLEGSFEKFDQQLQQQLTRALETMGRQLASLSQKFVTDYASFSDSLARITESMRRAG